MNHDDIEVVGAKTHNLKNFNLKLPLKKWIAVTGVSGSGKSSLVFDTIYAEAQRRFLETLGTYERQFLQGLPQGDFNSIDNLPAAVALKQSNKTGDPRSVIATSADVADSLRTLFMTFMESACSQCGSPVKLNRSSELIDLILRPESVSKNLSYIISVPFLFPNDKKMRKKICQDLLIEGYVRFLFEGQILSIEEVCENNVPENVEIVLDKLNAKINKDEILNRVETIWSQIKFATRFSFVYVRQEAQENNYNLFHVQPYCKKCDQKTNLIQSSDLDWQSALGACKTCHGLGNIPILDENKIIPNTSLSLKDGAIKPWNSDTFLWMKEELLLECRKNKIDILIPYSKLSDEDRNYIWQGGKSSSAKKMNQKSFVSLKNFFDVLEEERYKSTSRILLAKYRKYVTCPSCLGSRIGEVGRNALCFGKSYHELFQCEIHETLSWLKKIQSEKLFKIKQASISEIYREISSKISLLVKLGLGSATLFRRCKTLSGGEYQRVLLTRVIGNGLTDALYVLDEPSVGLGKNEIPSLIDCIRELRDLGNTILMVEHDTSLIFAADKIIELGPGGGEEGGFVLELENNIPISSHSDFKPRVQIGEKILNNDQLILKNFSAMNCKNLNVEIYLNKLNVITGVSGAGKSTLVTYGLQSALEKLEDTGVNFNLEPDDDSCIGIWEEINVPHEFFVHNNFVIVEQRALHRTITSVPATLLGLMDLLRKAFSQIPLAKQEGLGPSDFSFNGAGGCETCGGKGVVQDDLFFLGQVEKICPDCDGSRYKKQILNVLYKGKNIFQWLSTPMHECVKALGREKGFGKTLFLACELGLGHIPLGCPTSSMSGGEAQRLRICAALSKSSKKLFCILDEPTRGLSQKDVGHLLECLLRLTREGHTFVVVEHHEIFEMNADYLIEMGPGSGLNGGKVVKKIIQFSGR